MTHLRARRHRWQPGQRYRQCYRRPHHRGVRVGAQPCAPRPWLPTTARSCPCRQSPSAECGSPPRWHPGRQSQHRSRRRRWSDVRSPYPRPPLPNPHTTTNTYSHDTKYIKIQSPRQHAPMSEPSARPSPGCAAATAAPACTCREPLHVPSTPHSHPPSSCVLSFSSRNHSSTAHRAITRQTAMMQDAAS